MNQVSCASPGNCAATGNYTGAQDHNQAFVADEKNGTWEATCDSGPRHLTLADSSADTVSCASPGNCAAGGFTLNAGGGHAFLADQSTAPTMSAGQPGTASGGGQAR